MQPGTVFFVTGGAHGIGAATCALLVREGHRAVVADRDAEGAAALAKGLGAEARSVHLDVRAPEAWEHALDQAWQAFGRVDVLVNNAGLLHGGWVRDQSVEQLREMLDVNLLGLVHGVRAALPRFVAQGHGHVINVGSLACFLPLKGQTFYAATKHAVRGFHHGCVLEWAEAPVAWTLVCPGVIDTGMLRQQIDDDSNAIAFATRPLPPEAVARGILRAAEKQPAELVVPRSASLPVRLVGVVPLFLRWVTRLSERRGLRELARRRARGETAERRTG